MNELTKENSYCVYMHINKINNKFYIGMTGRRVEQRWGSNGCNYSTQTHFWNAIQKYGWDNFEHVVLLDQLTKEEACKIEILLIALLNTQDPNYGYNVSAGGDCGTSGLQMSDELKNKISESLKGRRAWNKGIKMPFRKSASNMIYPKKPKTNGSKRGTRAKKVIQYDLDGSFIRVWDSITEASRTLNIQHPCISDCCRGKQKTAGGFIWKYATEEEIEYAKNLSI